MVCLSCIGQYFQQLPNVSYLQRIHLRERSKTVSGEMLFKKVVAFFIVIISLLSSAIDQSTMKVPFSGQFIVTANVSTNFHSKCPKTCVLTLSMPQSLSLPLKKCRLTISSHFNAFRFNTKLRAVTKPNFY